MTEEQQNHVWAILPEDFKALARNLYRTSNIEQYEAVLETLFGPQNLKVVEFKVGDYVVVRSNVPHSMTPGSLTIFKKFPSTIHSIDDDGVAGLKLKHDGCTYGLFIGLNCLKRITCYQQNETPCR